MALIRPIRRLLAATAAAGLLGATVGIAPAAAHVTASSENPVRGGYATVTFAVPNESTTGAATTQLVITLPDVAAVRTETVPGWTAELDRDVQAGTVGKVTFTAESGGGIPTEQFGLFRVSMALPDTDTVSFPTVQVYDDGTRVSWDQETAADDTAEPEHPAPTLSLRAGTPDHAGPHSVDVGTHPSNPVHAADSTARVLGGAALLLGAVAIGVAMARRRS
ncbi:YcnI family copper-binding membrane protein [Mycolicibacillus trivialis]|uniref:Nuclear export factor GLE1 n=1 Tax=Mycolicibacillus trivialis TaxID=1798 RepID=A0A1X2EMQ5_9MYCO|nr:YcnI family protein [Mycolicibacillus trivialis]ORX06685.1 nuclear export factor GLE1 [Mycolicibacillus trivialis]